MERDIVRPLILALGITVAGLFIGGGFARGRAADRFVTVKGIAEREVRADLAIWPIRLVAADNDLTAAHSQLQRNLSQVRQFLARQQIDTIQAALQDFSVTDADANQYGSGNRVTNRYIIQQTIVVRSTRP